MFYIKGSPCVKSISLGGSSEEMVAAALSRHGFLSVMLRMGEVQGWCQISVYENTVTSKSSALYRLVKLETWRESLHASERE